MPTHPEQLGAFFTTALMEPISDAPGFILGGDSTHTLLAGSLDLIFGSQDTQGLLAIRRPFSIGGYKVNRVPARYTVQPVEKGVVRFLEIEGDEIGRVELVGFYKTTSSNVYHPNWTEALRREIDDCMVGQLKVYDPQGNEVTDQGRATSIASEIFRSLPEFHQSELPQ